MNNSQEALAQLQQAQSGAQNPQQLLANQQAQLGVQGQRDTVSGLRTAVDNTTKLLKQIAPSVMGRTQGSLVTNAQATRQISNEQAPIAQNLSEQGNNYNLARQDLSDLENRASQAANAEYTGQQDRLGYLQNIYSQLYQREQDAQTAAEQKRQFDAQLARSGSSGSGGGLDIASLLGALGGSSSAYGTSQNKSGGTSFTYQGQPITAAQYFQAKGGGINDVINFLKSDPTAKNAYNDAISKKFTPQQLAQKYSYIFGGV